MGAELLVASLWAVVIAYWFWSKRPASGDTVGLFRYELRALQGLSTARVPPANSLITNDAVLRPGPQPGGAMAGVAAVVLAPDPAALVSRKRARVRRRRLLVIAVLVLAVGATLLAALLTASTAAFVAHGVCDSALATYGLLLFWVRGAGADRPAPMTVAKPVTLLVETPTADSGDVDGYVPAHAFSSARRRVSSYGDFDSYARLALAQAN
jgi:hypothetical protein